MQRGRVELSTVEELRRLMMHVVSKYGTSCWMDEAKIARRFNPISAKCFADIVWAMCLRPEIDDPASLSVIISQSNFSALNPLGKQLQREFWDWFGHRNSVEFRL